MTTSPIAPRSSGIPYQSQNITFSEWLAQLTLCFAPYAAHVLTGMPSLVALQKPAPSWIHMVNFLNPTTIVWRYFMITDRRLRKRPWTPSAMAACNSAFWTGRTWAGDDNFMIKSGEYVLLQEPPRSRVSVVSVSAIGTLVVVFQGVQATYELFAQVPIGVTTIQALEGVFVPLAVFSLLRLPPALWLSDDFAWGRVNSGRSDVELEILLGNVAGGSQGQLEGRRSTQNSDVATVNFWPAILLRVAFVLLLALFIILGVAHLLTDHIFSGIFNPAILMEHFLYQFFVLVTIVTTVMYIWRKEDNTTIIPCINSYWYTVYTFVWYMWALVVIILNAVQMRRTSCGVYTTYTPEAGLDAKLCALFNG